jgi:hypothetical protein
MREHPTSSRIKAGAIPSLEFLREKQNAALGLASQGVFSAVKEADRFLSRVGIALRYHPGKGLPLASLYHAAAGPEPGKAALVRAIALTNTLLQTNRAIEVVVVADRVSLIHRSLMPALYALVRRGRAREDLSGLSLHARTAFNLIRERAHVTAGEVRKQLGLPFDPRRDGAYEALGELQRLLLVDRGPFEIPKSGIPYLSTEGYPYHFFHEVHTDLVTAASKHSVQAAAMGFLRVYLDGAVFATERKLASMFKVFLSAGEIEAALGGLAKKKLVTMSRIGRDMVALSTRHSGPS